MLESIQAGLKLNGASQLINSSGKYVPLSTALPFNLKQDRTSECDELKDGRPHERCMANVLVEHRLHLEPHEIFPENTHI